jgi:hypothetical protein
VPVGENTLTTANVGQMTPRRILFEEIERARTSLLILGSDSRSQMQSYNGKPVDRRDPPYLCCYYNAGDLGNVHIKAFSVPLLGDWELHEIEETIRTIDAFLNGE